MGKDLELGEYLKSLNMMKGSLKQKDDNKKYTAQQSIWNEQYQNKLISVAQDVLAAGNSAGQASIAEANRILSKAGKATPLSKAKLETQLDASIKTSIAKAQKAIALKKAIVSSPTLAAAISPARAVVAKIAAAPTVTATAKQNTAPPNINQIDMAAVNQAKLIFGNKMTKKQPAESASAVSNFVSKTKRSATVSDPNSVNADAVKAARAVMGRSK